MQFIFVLVRTRVAVRILSSCGLESLTVHSLYSCEQGILSPFVVYPPTDKKLLRQFSPWLI